MDEKTQKPKRRWWFLTVTAVTGIVAGAAAFISNATSLNETVRKIFGWSYTVTVRNASMTYVTGRNKPGLHAYGIVDFIAELSNGGLYSRTGMPRGG